MRFESPENDEDPYRRIPSQAFCRRLADTGTGVRSSCANNCTRNSSSSQPNWSSGFVPAAYQGTLFRPTGTPILDLSPPEGISRDAQRKELDLLAQLNDEHLRQRPGGGELAARAASYELAYRMQTEAPEAVDLTQETEATQTAYGVNQEPTAEFGRNCLIARRLVERGVRFVQLYSGGGHLEETWDAHESVEKNHGRHGAEIDQPIAALLQDLAERGLLDTTLIVWGGRVRPHAIQRRSRQTGPQSQPIRLHDVVRWCRSEGGHCVRGDGRVRLRGRGRPRPCARSARDDSAPDGAGSHEADVLPPGS